MTRTYGTGSVFQQADGKWVAQWELPRDGGPRRRRQRLAATEAAAWSLVPPMARPDPIESFWARVDKSGNCWLWTGSHLPKGYGLLRYEGRTHQAHRVSWILANGPIPDGLWVLHHCDNPPCVRPEHLFLGTALDNARDRDMKGHLGAAATSSL